MDTSHPFDAEQLRKVMVAYHDLLAAHRRRLNRLNVYPVPDADTGTNLAMTMQSVVDNLHAIGEAGDVCAAIGRGAMFGARGASGVILSQYLGAATRRLAVVASWDGRVLAEALDAAADDAYAAVSQPVEGTILTVARAAATAAAAVSDGSIPAVASAARDGAAAALTATPDLLPALRAAGVVDAGGAGLLLLFDAMLHVLTGTPLPEPAPEPVARVAIPAGGHGRYEVVVQLAATPKAMPRFRKTWEQLGNESTVVVESGGRLVAHVHTDDPEAAMDAARAAGRVLEVQVTDLVAQVAELTVADRPGLRTALVAVVDGDGLRELFHSRGTSVIVTGGPARNPSTAELLDAVEKASAPEVIILPNERTIVPAAQQVPSLTEITVRVAPTRTIAEGIAALDAIDSATGADDNVARIAAATATVRSGSVTRAVRDAETDRGAIRRGDWLAMTPEGLLGVADRPETVLMELGAALVDVGATRLTIIAGAEADESVVGEVAAWASDRWPGLDCDVVDGGQALYPYLVGVETRKAGDA